MTPLPFYIKYFKIETETGTLLSFVTPKRIPGLHRKWGLRKSSESLGLEEGVPHPQDSPTGRVSKKGMGVGVLGAPESSGITDLLMERTLEKSINTLSTHGRYLLSLKIELEKNERKPENPH